MTVRALVVRWHTRSRKGGRAADGCLQEETLPMHVRSPSALPPPQNEWCPANRRREFPRDSHSHCRHPRFGRECGSRLAITEHLPMSPFGHVTRRLPSKKGVRPVVAGRRAIEFTEPATAENRAFPARVQSSRASGASSPPALRVVFTRLAGIGRRRHPHPDIGLTMRLGRRLFRRFRLTPP